MRSKKDLVACIIALSNSTTLQRTQYYPSGLPWAANTGDNPGLQNKKYNAKEFIEMHGYDISDYGWRGLENAMMRFNTIDPMAEEHFDYTPYAYCYNNPILFIDPFGLDTVLVNRNGKFAKEMIKGGEKDVFVLVSNKERRIGQIDYSKEHKSVNINRVDDGKGGTKNAFNITQDKNGAVLAFGSNAGSKEVFEFLADNTSVEFSHFTHEGGDGSKFNFVTTNRSYEDDNYGVSIVAEQLKVHRRLTMHTHSHPDTQMYYGQDQTGPSDNDINAYKKWAQYQYQPFNAYIRNKNQTRPAPFTIE